LGYSYRMIKIDATGSPLWSQTIQHSFPAQCISIFPTNSNSVIWLSAKINFNLYNGIAVTKTDVNGIFNF